MSKIRIVVFVFILIFITGCRADYVVNIDGNEISESFYFVVNRDEIIGKDIYNSIEGKMLEYTGETTGISDSVITSITNYSSKESAVKFFSSYNNFNDYRYSAYLHACYDLVNVSEMDNNYFNVTTSDYFRCFDKYSELDNINVIVETNNDVSYSNCDYIDGKKYVWNINKDNYMNKKISITISNFASDDAKYRIKDVNFMSILFICLICLFISFIVFMYFFIKNKRVNKIP